MSIIGKLSVFVGQAICFLCGIDQVATPIVCVLFNESDDKRNDGQDVLQQPGNPPPPTRLCSPPVPRKKRTL